MTQLAWSHAKVGPGLNKWKAQDPDARCWFEISSSSRTEFDYRLRCTVKGRRIPEVPFPSLASAQKHANVVARRERAA